MTDTNAWSIQRPRRVPRRVLLRGAGAAGAGIALAACGGGKKTPQAGSSSAPAAAQPKQGGTISYFSLDPAYYKQADMNTALNSSIWHLIGKRALTLDGKTKKLQPETVEKWEIPGDGSEFILHVRPGIKIHNKPPANGREFTAEDLAFNIERIAGKLDPQHLALYQRATTMAGLDHAEAVDKLTCKVTMARPSSTFLAGLTEIRNELMPKDVVLANLFSDITALAGHGPFMVKEYQDAQKMTAVRHPDYFVSGQPHADQYQVLILPDAATGLAAFISGKLDLYTNPPKEQIAAIKAARPDAAYLSYPDLNWDHLRFQVEKPPFNDFRVRRAIFLALDYKELAESNYGNEWSYTGPLVPEHPEALTVDQLKQLPGYNPNTKDKDRQEARQLMAAAGYPDGEISMQILPGSTTPTNMWYTNGLRVQDGLKKIWPKMNVQFTPAPDTAAFNRLQAEGNFSTISYTITSLPDAALEFASQWHTAGGLLGSRNYGHFKNAEADALIDKAFTTLDNEARKSLLLDFQKKYLEQWLPAIQLCEEFDRVFTGPSLRGFDQITGPWWYTTYRVNDRAGTLWKQ